MKEQELYKKFDALAKQMNVSTDEVVRLCTDMVRNVASAEQEQEQVFSRQHAEIEAKRKQLRKKNAGGARRTHGSLTFSV